MFLVYIIYCSFHFSLSCLFSKRYWFTRGICFPGPFHPGTWRFTASVDVVECDDGTVTRVCVVAFTGTRNVCLYTFTWGAFLLWFSILRNITYRYIYIAYSIYSSWQQNYSWKWHGWYCFVCDFGMFRNAKTDIVFFRLK